MRILVVEDEPLIARALVDGLRGEGYAVDHTARGDEAVWMATEQAYDAILLDVMLPGMNGYLVCRTLRQQGTTTPIVMLTAKDGEYDQAEGLDTGADDYVTKPFSFVVLLARLRAVMRRGQAARLPVLRVGGLELDPSDHRVTRDGVPIEVTPREFSLLRYLMHHAGRAVTKQELVEGVWGDDEIDANVVQVYVGYLRRKVDEPFGTATIQTVRGVGYRVDADR
ncbi:MAG: response regulator transcription factor [Acidimicrobiales bacterium]|nr:response regulator transcription factor [Acidimicrobiales bacterium]MCB9395773.1 response regulator transcription factor [Acidimicrobiaceae bacterium]